MTSQFETFIKLMMLSTSSSDGEALSALRKANAILDSTNQTWEALLRGKVKHIEFPEDIPDLRPKPNKHSDPEIETWFDTLLSEVRGGFRDYVESVHDFWERTGFLTDKQYAAIKKAYDNRRRR